MTTYYLDNGYEIDSDVSRLDIVMIHKFLSIESYWARGRTREVVEDSIRNSFCLGVYAQDGRQVGFARLVSDWTTFGWICDLFIQENERGKGLGKQIVKTIVSMPNVAKIRRLMLSTSDAHSLYKKYGGFTVTPSAENVLEKVVSSS